MEFDGLPDDDRLLIDSIRKAAYICGYSNDEIKYAVYQVLKRIGWTDLLLRCEQESEDIK